MKVIKIILHIVLISLLTVLTQVGGLIWIITIIISIKFKKRKRIVFPIIYLLFNLVFIPPIAKAFGREQLPITSKNLKPRNWVYPLLFRNYVSPKLKNILIKSTNESSFNHVQITYLDANFPFINGFPLFPHLSHNDGKKIDVSFMYLDKEGNTTNKKPSISGYGVYVLSKYNLTLQSCLDKGYWQYDFSKYLTFGTIHNLELDKKQTNSIIRALLSYPETQKIFIEPHLKKLLGLSYENKIRFHGCQAVRHDDHIHLQIN
jgi:hypothetical protein